MHKTSKGGTYRIDRVFPGVGRIALNSGATTRRAFDLRNDLLTRLYRDGEREALLALRAGRFTLTDLYAADRAGTLDALVHPPAPQATPLTANLWDAIKVWQPAAPSLTERRYAVSFATLRRVGPLGPDATVADVDTVDWARLAKTWPGSASNWNHLRRALSHFLAVYLGDLYHPFRLGLFGRRQAKEPPRVPKRKEVERVPDLPPDLFRDIVAKAERHVQPAFITIAAMGLRVGEYLHLQPEHLLPHSCAVRVPGTKTDASADTVRVHESLWPYIVAAVPSPVQYKWLRLYWKRALKAAGADPTLRLHDLRHCYGQWLADNNVSEARIQTGLRHASPAMTRRYTKQRDKGENAAVMGAVLGAALKTA